jgi:KTSC domain
MLTQQSAEVNWEETTGFASSNIAAFRFDRDTDTLQVDFNDGSTYEYFNVAPATHRSFQSAPSKGEFFRRVIRGKYPYERL